MYKFFYIRSKQINQFKSNWIDVKMLTLDLKVCFYLKSQILSKKKN